MPRLETPWAKADAIRQIFAGLAAEGGQGWFVGGCVRDALLSKSVGDIDIATDLPPKRVMAALEKTAFRLVPTGLDHGTITVVTTLGAVEVTTLRRDIETDGRRAVVAFTQDLKDDAARRDFTLNALYADPSGKVIDPTGQGLDDALSGTVRFVGQPDQRIVEDYLRILRYFRFLATHGNPLHGVDAEALSAVATHAPSLDTISAERKTAELIKLLAAENPAVAVGAMQSSGVLHRVLPGGDAQYLAPLVHIERRLGLSPDPLRRLVAITPNSSEDLLRLSKKQSRRVRDMRTSLALPHTPKALGYRLGAELALDTLSITAAMLGNDVDPAIKETVKAGAAQVCPVSAVDLMDRFSGRALGEKLAQIESRWIASDFCMDKPALLATL